MAVDRNKRIENYEKKMHLIKTIYYDVTVALFMLFLVTVFSASISTNQGSSEEEYYGGGEESISPKTTDSRQSLFAMEKFDIGQEFIQTIHSEAEYYQRPGRSGDDGSQQAKLVTGKNSTTEWVMSSSYNIAGAVAANAKSVTTPDNVTRLMTEEGLLKRWLFRRYGLHITDRPVLRHEDTVPITVKFELLRFLHIDDLRGSMAVLAVVVLTWNNPFLAWQGSNVTESRISRLALKSGEVWTPLILHLNNVKELNVVDKYGRGRGNMVMELFENGTQLWPPTGIYESSCDLNFTYFPLDKQTCAFVFESWLADEFVNITEATAAIHDDRTFISKSLIWEFKHLSAWTRTIHYGDSQYSQAWVVVSMRRRHAYYTWNILVPCGCLSLLQLSTFVLPPETPERASFSVTVLVAFGILQTIIKAEIPTTSDTVLLVIYVVGQLAVGTLATFYIVVSVGLGSYSFPQFPQSKKRKNNQQAISNRRHHLDNIAQVGQTAHSPEAAKDLLANTTSSPSPSSGTHKRRQNTAQNSEQEQMSDITEDPLDDNTSTTVASGPRRYTKRIIDRLFFQRPILETKTIRIMDAIAFTILATLTFVGHVTIYALLNAAASSDDDYD